MLTLFLLTFHAFAAPDCAKDLSALKTLLNDPQFPLVWIETSADDGKPLVVTLSERDAKIHLEFDKTKEGLWASGGADIGKNEGQVVAHITKEHIKLGKAAHWVVKMSMSGGAKFTLAYQAPNSLHISTFGWKGDFVPQKKEPPLEAGVPLEAGTKN